MRKVELMTQESPTIKVDFQAFQMKEIIEDPVLKNVFVPPPTKFSPKVPPRTRVIATKLISRQKCVNYV